MHIPAVCANRFQNAVKLVAVVGALMLLQSLGSSRALAQSCQPALLGTANTPAAARGVVVKGSLAYVADELRGQKRGLRVIDVSDPNNPTIVGSVDTPGQARDVAVIGTLAYVADGNKGLQVIDVSVPSNPIIIGSVFTNDVALGVAVSGAFAYIADDGRGLTVIDVSDPTTPVHAGNAIVSSNQAVDVAVSGTLAFVANRNSSPGLVVIDVSDPSNPVVLNAGGPRVTPFALGVAVRGTLAYVADANDGLQVIDVSNPANPVLVGTVRTADTAREVAIDNSLAYIAEGNSTGQGSTFEVIDVRTPTNPVVVGSIAGLSNWSRGIAVSGPRVYRAADFSGLQVIDVTSCGPPSISSQPVCVIFLEVSGPAQLSITAESNLPETYQWFRDGFSLVDGPTTTGATTPTLTVQVNSADVGFYDCVVTNSAGQAFSDPAVVALRFPAAPPGDPTGACCLSQGGCVSTTEANCFDANGFYLGDDVACAQAGCSPPPGSCLGDGNFDGSVNFSDITAVLGNWLSICP